MNYKVTVNFSRGPAFSVELTAIDVFVAAEAGRKFAVECGFGFPVKKTVVVPA